MKRAIQTTIWTLGFYLMGCSSLVDHPMIGGEADPGAPKVYDFVEVYVEFVGPHERWAGPTSFTLHVDTRGTVPEGLAQIQVYPPSFLAKTANPNAHRVPASEQVAHAPNRQLAKEEINNLARNVYRKPSSSDGCINPIKVRFVRNDGEYYSKEGCRSTAHWVEGVSGFVSNYLERAE